MAAEPARLVDHGAEHGAPSLADLYRAHSVLGEAFEAALAEVLGPGEGSGGVGRADTAIRRRQQPQQQQSHQRLKRKLRAAFDAALDAEMTALEEQHPRKRRKGTVAPVIMEGTIDLLSGSRGTLHLQTRAAGRLAITPSNDAFVAAATATGDTKRRDAALRRVPRNKVERTAAARGISLELVRQWEQEHGDRPALQGPQTYAGLKALGIEVEELPAIDIWTAKG